MTDLLQVTCPTCFEVFEAASPSPEEVPCEVDYDCEICCRPLFILFSEESGEIYAEGRGLGE